MRRYRLAIFRVLESEKRFKNTIPFILYTDDLRANDQNYASLPLSVRDDRFNIGFRYANQSSFIRWSR